ncbi:MAG: carbohydrate ABC transporter permease [Candidatus Sumerlaeota bacterium]
MKRIGFAILVALILIYALFPFYWALNTSAQSAAQISALPVHYMPAPFSFESYRQVLGNSIFLRGLLNSALVAGSVTALSLLTGSLAAYALARFTFSGRRPALYLILAMTTFPQIAIVGSLFRMVSAAGLFNSMLALIITNLLTTLPFTVWVLTSFFRSLPRDLEEASYVDGASTWQTLWHVMLPLTAPGFVTTALLAFIACWNEYLFALSFTEDQRARTATVVVAQFSGEFTYEVPFGQIMAGGIITVIPLIILVLIFQRRIVSGLTAGAVKG